MQIVNCLCLWRQITYEYCKFQIHIFCAIWEIYIAIEWGTLTCGGKNHVKNECLVKQFRFTQRHIYQQWIHLDTLSNNKTTGRHELEMKPNVDSNYIRFKIKKWMIFLIQMNKIQNLKWIQMFNYSADSQLTICNCSRLPVSHFVTSRNLRTFRIRDRYCLLCYCNAAKYLTCCLPNPQSSRMDALLIAFQIPSSFSVAHLGILVKTSAYQPKSAWFDSCKCNLIWKQHLVTMNTRWNNSPIA